jgi:hypothetical protein
MILNLIQQNQNLFMEHKIAQKNLFTNKDMYKQILYQNKRKNIQ